MIEIISLVFSDEDFSALTVSEAGIVKRRHLARRQDVRVGIREDPY